MAAKTSAKSKSSDVDELTDLVGSQLQIHDVEESYKELDEKLKSVDSTFDTIEVFFHVTTQNRKVEIEKDKLLKRNRAILPECVTQGSSRGSPLYNTESQLEGVFFCCSLFQHRLPDRSPYGTDRVKIPVEYLVQDDTHLFYNSWHSITTGRNKVHYIILVLVDKLEYPKEFKYCSEKLKELNIKRNHILKLNKKKRQYKCYHSESFREFNPYIEILVVGDVELTSDGISWDSVTETGRAQK